MKRKSGGMADLTKNFKKFFVEFTEEKTVAAVPTTWIFEEDGTVKCRWPKKFGPNCLDLIKEPNSLPRENWKNLPVRVFQALCSGK